MRLLELLFPVKPKPMNIFDMPGVLEYNNRCNRAVPDFEGEIGQVKHKEFADGIDRHWKTVGKED